VYAEPRIALLIGNQAYAEEVGPLKNPINDIDQVGAALGQLGFTVEQVQNAGFGNLHKAVNRYVRRLGQAGEGAIGFFYYSGHGGANPDDKKNYLIPVDVRSADEEQLWDDSIRLDGIIDKLSKEASQATHFVVFDACRNELQLKKRGAKALGRRKGFQPERQHPAMLIAYSTAPGEIATDVGAGAGPYAKALAEELVIPGIQALVMFQNVQEKVHANTGQVPWMSTPYLPKIYLAGVPAAGPAPIRPPTSVLTKGVWLDLSQRQKEWFHLTSWLRKSELTFKEIKQPFGANDLPAGKGNVLILPLPFQEHLSNAKIDTLTSWVEKGGGLLILGYYAPDIHHGSNPSQLTRKWGITFDQHVLLPAGLSCRKDRAHPFSSADRYAARIAIPRQEKHPIVANVSELALVSSTTLNIRTDVVQPELVIMGDSRNKICEAKAISCPPDDSTRCVIDVIDYGEPGSSRSLTVLVAFTYGLGRVAIAGTWKIANPDRGDNKLLMHNLIQWLGQAR
jgi:hypothetical protein